MSIVKELLYRLRGEYTTEKLVKMGLKVGKNFKRLNNVILDPGHCWLLEIGDNVTMAPRVHILCHDASTKTHLGYTKIGRVTIEDNVFIGASAVVLPCVRIGKNSIIGANSVITKDVPEGVVVAGNPAKIICTTEEYLEKQRKNMETSSCYGTEYTLSGGITEERKAKMKEELADKGGFVV